jgi:hypothetical protein
VKFANELIASVYQKLMTVPKPPEGKGKSFPFVKLIGAKWKVSVAQSPTEGYADFEKRIIHVPIDASPTSERTRFHELAHVKWTPNINPGIICAENKIPMSFLNAFEDCRVNERLIRTDESFVDLMEDGMMVMDVEGAIDIVRDHRLEMNPAELQAVTAAMYVCSRGYGEADDMKKLAEYVRIPMEAIDAIIDTVLDERSTFDTSVAASIALRDLLKDDKEEEEEEKEEEEEGKKEKGEKGEKSEGSSGGEPATPETGEDEEDEEGRDEPEEEKDEDPDDLDNNAVDEIIESLETSPAPIEKKPDTYTMYRKPSGTEGGRKDPEGGEEGSGKLKDVPDGLDGIGSYGSLFQEGGAMQIFRPPLRDRIVLKMHRPTIKKQDYEGGEIRQIHRLRLDEKVMRRKAPLKSRRRVGTLLVDASGSMSIKVSQLTKILQAAPQVTVAVYSSNNLDAFAWRTYGTRRQSHSVGHLAVVAHRGKRISDEEIKPYLGGGNVVDVEALRWLAAQPKPRFWVCDGHVTGIGDASGQNLNEECLKIAKRANIKRVSSVAGFLDLLGED